MIVNKNSSLLGRYSAKEDIIFKNQNDKGTLLLLEQPKENTQILKTIGFDHYISEVEADVHIKNSKVVIGQLFGKPAFLGSEIKKVCNDYDLVISKVSNYKGAPFQDLPEIIQAFMDANFSDVVVPAKTERKKVFRYKEDCITPDYYSGTEDQKFDWRTEIISEERIEKKSKIKTGYSNWFIMAPRESFNGNKKNTCCTLFYRDNEDSKSISENDVFTEVYSWGSNYSDVRKYNYFLKNINWEKETNLRNKSLNQNELKHQNISLILCLFFLIVLNVISYFYSFTAMCIVTGLILSYLYLSIRKPCKEYYNLWRI
jgi:hypothetical protein